MATANDIIKTMLAMQNEQQRQVLCRFFKTAKGEYGEGDKFLGLKVPQTRSVVRSVHGNVMVEEIAKLLASEWHEVRLCGFLLLVDEMKVALPTKRKNGNPDKRQAIADFYLHHARRANNWDLVDLSSPYILGLHLLHPMANGEMPDRSILDKLALSCNLWEQRIAIVSTLPLIRNQQYTETLRIATILLPHPHDLIHKAVGWMLREVGKQNIDELRNYLSNHISEMPRTTLRYAIERMNENERKEWLKK